MVGLRSRHVFCQRIKIAIISSFVVACANVALAGHWKVENTQYESDPDFEFHCFVYEIVGGIPNLLTVLDYDYAGPVEWNYAWTVGPYSVYNPQATPVYCEVWNQYGGTGSWYRVDSFYADWVDP